MHYLFSVIARCIEIFFELRVATRYRQSLLFLITFRGRVGILYDSG